MFWNRQLAIGNRHFSLFLVLLSLATTPMLESEVAVNSIEEIPWPML